jgi:hypothetical protein
VTEARTEDAAFFDRALRRLDRIALVLAAAAVVVFLAREGWRGALGCGFTAAASVYNLRRLKAIAAGVGGEGGSGRSGAGAAVALGLRYLILGAICFVIIKFAGVSLAAVFAGLLISVAAVLAEILYELLFIR